MRLCLKGSNKKQSGFLVLFLFVLCRYIFICIMIILWRANETMIIQHNISAQLVQNRLKQNSKSQADVTEKLSSGYKINRAADDAAGLTISEEMRGQIRGLEQASENIQHGMSLLQTGDGAMNEIHSMLQRQRELLVQAGNDTNTPEDKALIDQEIQQLSDGITEIARNTEFNTIKILSDNMYTQYLAGPTTVTTDITPTPNPTVTNTNSSSTTTVMISTTTGPPLPNPNTVTTTNTTPINSSTYSDTETEYILNNQFVLDTEKTVTTTTGTTTVKTDVTTEYTKITDPTLIAPHTNLRPPNQSVSSSGYMNFTNQSNTLKLSCAMSQLGVLVDGSETRDVCSAQTNVINHTHSVLPDGSTEDIFKLNNGIEITQKVALITMPDQYNITYEVKNTDTVPHDITLRMAFDALNTDAVKQEDIPGVGSAGYTLATDLAKIELHDNTSPAADKSVLGNIEDMYNSWNATSLNPGTNVTGKHTGVGFWWERDGIPAGGSFTCSVSYGPIQLLSEPYEKKVDTNVETTVDKQVLQEVTTATELPPQLMIQTGANTQQAVSVRLTPLTAGALQLDQLNINNIDDSLILMDRAIDKVSATRSRFGAYFNRFEHAMSVDDISAENLQAAESRIRDADMTELMVMFAGHDILASAGEAMLAQANQAPETALQLLESLNGR